MTRLSERRGAAYILALVTMVTGLILGAAALQISTEGYRAEMARQHKAAAQALADAGVDYAYWQLRWTNSDAVAPLSTSLTLSSGTVNVSAIDNGNTLPSTFQITSTGTSYGVSATAVRVVQGKMPYDYAISVNGSSTLSCDLSDGTGAPVRLNGGLLINNWGTTIRGSLRATSSITVQHGLVTGPQFPSSPPIWFPTIDLTAYQAQAASIYTGNKTFYGITFPYSGAIVYVSGVAYISGLVYGKGTIVAAGGISVTGSLYPVGSAVIALVSPSQIHISSFASSVSALMYSHAATGNGNIQIDSSTTVVGCMAADTLSFNSYALVSYSQNSNVDHSTYQLLRLPGFL